MQFWGVEYLNVPTILRGVQLEQALPEDVHELKRATGIGHDPSSAYRLVSTQRVFCVVAAGYKVLRNEMGIMESSLMYADKQRTMADYGEVLAHSEGIECVVRQHRAG